MALRCVRVTVTYCYDMVHDPHSGYQHAAETHDPQGQRLTLRWISKQHEGGAQNLLTFNKSKGVIECHPLGSLKWASVLRSRALLRANRPSRPYAAEDVERQRRAAEDHDDIAAD